MFKNCKTLEELKTEYHKLVLLHHPDRGGDEETMKAVNASYDKYFPILKTIHTNKDGKQYTKETDETPEYFKDIMNRLMAFEKINIEIIGCFIWITGETKPIHESLKAMKFKWHAVKSCWYLSPDGYRRKGKREYDLETIRSMYGSKRYESEGSCALEA